VRMLSDSPSLDDLRRQAKDLLVGLRETRPGAALADAQTALARNYGFRSWPELKIEVERRRSRTDIADATVAGTIANRFGLGAVAAPMRSLAQTNEVGRPWTPETDAGRWTAKQLNCWFGVANLVENAETDVRLQYAAADAGVMLPRPVRSISGHVIELVDGQNWRVNAWIGLRASARGAGGRADRRQGWFHPGAAPQPGIAARSPDGTLV